MEPMQCIDPVSSLIQMGSGVPQYRLREIAQSVAPLASCPCAPAGCVREPNGFARSSGEFVPVFLHFHIPRVDGPIDDGVSDRGQNG